MVKKTKHRKGSKTLVAHGEKYETPKRLTDARGVSAPPMQIERFAAVSWFPVIVFDLHIVTILRKHTNGNKYKNKNNQKRAHHIFITQFH